MPTTSPVDALADLASALTVGGAEALGPAVEHLIVVDFEGTCNLADDGITRLQQCDIHEIIEFPAL